MLKYFLVFSILGFALSALIKNDKPIFVVFAVIAAVWGISTASIWGFVSFGELCIGFSIYKIWGNKDA